MDLQLVLIVANHHLKTRYLPALQKKFSIDCHSRGNTTADTGRAATVASDQVARRISSVRAVGRQYVRYVVERQTVAALQRNNDILHLQLSPVVKMNAGAEKKRQWWAKAAASGAQCRLPVPLFSSFTRVNALEDLLRDMIFRAAQRVPRAGFHRSVVEYAQNMPPLTEAAAQMRDQHLTHPRP